MESPFMLSAGSRKSAGSGKVVPAAGRELRTTSPGEGTWGFPTMKNTSSNVLLLASLMTLGLIGIPVVQVAGQEANGAVAGHAPPAVMHLTLEDAKQRALHNNKLLNLASLNAESKAFAVRAAQAD